MHVVKGVWWNGRTGNAKSWICALTDLRILVVCTLMRSGFGVSDGGSRAQLDTFSTGLNLRSDNGLCTPMVALKQLAQLSLLSSKDIHMDK